MGKAAENVRRYQTALQNKGYDVGGIDGIAGDKTYNAILKFPSDNGLDADGMCGTQTQTKLFGASQGGGTTSSTLKLGSNGSLTQVFADHVEYNGVFAERGRAFLDPIWRRP